MVCQQPRAPLPASLEHVNTHRCHCLSYAASAFLPTNACFYLCRRIASAPSSRLSFLCLFFVRHLSVAFGPSKPELHDKAITTKNRQSKPTRTGNFIIIITVISVRIIELSLLPFWSNLGPCKKKKIEGKKKR